MKKIFALAFVCLIVLTGYSDARASIGCSESSDYSGSINDGWYEATVKYSNYKTGTYATYTLNVKVEYGSVTKIDFGNGGSVHTGYNNEGYIYSGGYLIYKKNYDGDVVAATTTVTVSDSNGMRNFEIRIE